MMTTPRDSAERRARKFGHLRSLVHGPQTPGAWLSVCALLGGWPQEELEDVLIYAAHGLSEWPASVRVMPSKPKLLISWMERPRLWRLIGALSLSSPSELERYMSGDWSGLRQLKLSIDSDIAQWTARLEQWEGVVAVTSLELTVASSYRFDGAPLLKLLSRLPWRLEALSVTEHSAECDDELSGVWAGEWLERLKRLELSLGRAILLSFYKAIQEGAFGALEVFRVQGGVMFTGVAEAVDAPIWSGLEEVSHVSSDGWLVLEGLSRAGATPRVLELQLHGEDSRVRLLAAPLLEGLERVTISYCSVLSQVLTPIVERAPRLKSLTLHSGLLGGAPPPSLTGLAQLEELFWASTHVEPSWCEWFVRHEIIARLRRLQLFHESLPAAQILPILEALYEPGEPLSSLSLTGCGLNVQQLYKIVDSGRLEECEKLVLSHNSFNSLSRQALMDLFLDPERWSTLRHLSIRSVFHIFAPDDVRLLRARFHQVAI